MPKNRSALRAGLLMIGSVAAIILVVIGIKGLSWIRDRSTNHLVAFDLRTNIGGLRVGDEVRVGGFKVGEVKNITLVKDDDQSHPPYYILVTISVPERYSIREDAKVRVDGTLTGTSWLNFEDLGRGSALPPHRPLIGMASATTELIAKVGGLAPEIQSMLTEIRTKTLPAVNGALADVQNKTVPLVNQTLESFKKTGDNTAALTDDFRKSYDPVLLAEYKRVMDKAADMLEALRAFFGDTAPDWRTTLANLNKSTTAIQAKLPGMLDKLDSALAGIDTSVDKVSKTMDDVQQTVLHAKDLTGSAKAVVVGNRSKLDGMIASLKTAGDNLKAATAEIRRSPWRLLYKPAPNEMANLNLYDAARQFAEGANDLNDTASALRDLLKNNPNADPAEVKRLMDKVDQSFSNFQQVEQKLWTNVKE
jgi:ABC-type transporter Mla subunit MlaD